jgi:hypothetical protein
MVATMMMSLPLTCNGGLRLDNDNGATDMAWAGASVSTLKKKISNSRL